MSISSCVYAFFSAKSMRGLVGAFAAGTANCPAQRAFVRLAALACILALLGGCASRSVKPSEGGNKEGSTISVYLPEDDNVPLSPEEMNALVSVGDFDRTVSGENMRDVYLHFKAYVHQNRRTVERNIERGEPFLPYIRETLKKYKLPQDLAYLPFVESGYDPLAKSRTGALGMWQFVNGTGLQYGMQRSWWIDERHDSFQATHAALTYLTKLHERFNDWHLAITSYNAGEGRVSRALAGTGTKDFFELRRVNHTLPEKDQLSEESKQYLPRFLAVAKIMRNLDSLGFRQPDHNKGLQLAELNVRPGTDLLALCKGIGVEWEEFALYNAAYLRYISPPDRHTKVYVPSVLSQHAEAHLSQATRRGPVGWKTYKVAKGDNFSRIAKKTSVPVAELRRVNQMSEPLKAGTVVFIPGSSKSGLKYTPAVASSARATRATSARTASVEKNSATQPSSAPKGTAERRHTVAKGETLYSIAARYNVAAKAIQQANGLGSTALPLGKTLRIPGAPASGATVAAKGAETSRPSARTSTKKSTPSSKKQSSYTVQPGDTVWGIARKFNMPPERLMQANKLSRESRLRPGENIFVER